MAITKIKFTSLLILSLLLLNCSSDDNGNNGMMDDDTMMEDPQEILDMERAANILILTGNDIEKVWRIGNATLESNGTTIDLSNNFNVTDDEFIFSGTATNGMLEWRPGNAINLNGTTNQETLLDYYLAPINSPITFLPESATNITTLDGGFIFEVVDENTITGTLNTSGRSQADGDLTITLNQKTQADYANVPENGLNFSLVTSFNTTNGSILGSEGATGFRGSYSDNSFFVVSRDNSQNTGNGSPEQILKYNVDSNTFEENLFYQQQFVSKRLNIINNELVVFGGQFVNTYPLNPNGDATSVFQHDLGLTRFSFAAQGDFGYTAGGDQDNTGSGTAPNAIVRSYNYLSNQFQTIATLSKPRFFAGSEVVNNKLYVFGGRPTFPGEGNPDAESFIIDVNNGSTTSFAMPEAPYLSYASRNEHLIYVGYETRIDDGGDANQFDKQINFGVYNTLDDTFMELPHNLDDSGQLTTISAITVFNDKLYVLYGDIADTSQVSIFSAPI